MNTRARRRREEGSPTHTHSGLFSWVCLSSLVPDIKIGGGSVIRNSSPGNAKRVGGLGEMAVV